MTSLIEQLRFEAVNDLFQLKGFGSGWEPRRVLLSSILGAMPSKSRFIDLGENLSEAFKILGSTNRSQSSLSTAGSTWEALVVWYLNLCLVGTRAVCVRGPRLCPAPIRDALSVSYESSILRNEPDVILISSETLARAPSELNRKLMLSKADTLIAQTFASTGVVNFQCKTNWNDNAQIPMLWNMLYNQAQRGAVIPNGFTIGRNGHSLSTLGAFGYSFVTVPTQKKGPEGYKPAGTDVLRAKTMTAGNYWGYPTRNGVCFSLAEFFNQFHKNSGVFPNSADVGAAASLSFDPANHGTRNLSVFRLTTSDDQTTT